MVGEKAQYRLEVLQFGKSGLAPTLEALKLKRRTLYPLAKAAQNLGQDLAQNEKAKAPRRRRKWPWPKEVHEEISG
jgi:hypothetical protein